jgi:small-conductance mechanosensitive channel
MAEDWTPAQLKTLFDQKIEDRDKAVAAAFAAQEKLVSAALAAAERAVLKAEAAAERRFESVNEFRQTLSDQQANLMPRKEAQVELNAIREKVDEFASRLERHEAKGAGISAGWGYLVGLIGFLAAVAGLASRFIS